MRVLVVEDHRDIAANIGDYLDGHGIACDFAMDGISAMHLALTETFDVIVLDLNLPGMDGLSFCRRLRTDAERTTPVLMLTARDTLGDKLAGFTAGADDYLVKPFALPELLARIQALSKRGRVPRAAKLAVGDLELNTDTREVRRAGRRLELGPAGYKLLQALIQASPRVLDRAELEGVLWGDSPPDSDALRSHLYTLRRIIDRPFDVPLLHTIHGQGYQLAVRNDRA